MGWLIRAWLFLGAVIWQGRDLSCDYMAGRLGLRGFGEMFLLGSRSFRGRTANEWGLLEYYRFSRGG